MTVLDAYPFDQGVGSNSGQVRWQKVGKLWSANGVVPQAVTGLAGELSSSFATGNITVQPGGVVINGTYGELANVTNVPAASNGLLVARLDNANYQLVVAFNAGASTPVQNPTTWELPLASLSGTTLTDQRSFANPRTAFPNPPGGAAVSTYTDSTGRVYCSKNGSAWLPATQVLKSKVYRNAAWTQTSGATVPFDVASWDPYQLSNGTTFTAPIAGDYLFSFQVGVANQPAQYWLVGQVRRGGAAVRNYTGWNAGTTPGNCYVQGSDQVQLAAGDGCDIYVTILGGNLPGITGFVATYVDWRYLSPQ